MDEELRMHAWVMVESRTSPRTKLDFTLSTLQAMTEIIDLTNLPSSSEAGDDSQTEHSDSSVQEDEDTSYSDEDGVDEALLSDPNVRDKLRAAILAVPDERLRRIVLDLVRRVPEAERALYKELLAVHHRELVQRWETCDKCGEEFDANEERSTGECQFHPGASMHTPQYAMWANHDARRPGTSRGKLR